jgi:acetyltransferase-like isoleucine patch superfamily enzyme
VGMKRLAKLLIQRTRPLIVEVLSMFFERRYLRGRHFEVGFSGYVWAVRAIWQRNILRLARTLPFPAALTTHVSSGTRIDFHPDDLNNFQSPGTYFQNFSGRITLGKGCYIGPNVGIITANHDPLDPDRHLPPLEVIIGERCWVGMNSVILPGVTLGPRTVVGAGAVVTKSFPRGDCVIGGVPAKVIKNLVRSRAPPEELT